MQTTHCDLGSTADNSVKKAEAGYNMVGRESGWYEGEMKYVLAHSELGPAHGGWRHGIEEGGVTVQLT